MMDEDIYSNLALIPFTLAGFTWHSAEQYFQAAKFTDAEIIQRIQACPNPFRCASLGQTRRFKIRDDWETIKVSVMETAIRARFAQHPELAQILKLSRHPLSDHSAADSFWGPGVDGHGTNMTGQILMQIRRELQANQK